MSVKRRTTAWTLSWLCVLVILYASLYPFEDWRNQGIAPWSFVTAPWPKYNTWFDINSNVLGYAPLGFWLCLAGMRSSYSRARAWLLAAAGSCVLSFGMESMQSFLPMRVPSNLDWLLNTVGGMAGAVVAVGLEKRGWLYRWSQFRREWLTHDAKGSLVLLALWPVALLFPVTVPLGLGHVVDVLRRFFLERMPEVETRFSNALEWWSQPMTPALEMGCVTLGMLVPGLLAMALCRRLQQRMLVILAATVLSVLGNALSATLTYGPEHAWYWLSPQSGSGLALGLCVLVLMLKGSELRLTQALFLVQLLLLLLLNLSPVSVYYEQTMQTWEQGRFIRFHGLTLWLNWLWPWALLFWAGWRLRHKDLHSHQL
jgi:VanZ family protein